MLDSFLFFFFFLKNSTSQGPCWVRSSGVGLVSGCDSFVMSKGTPQVALMINNLPANAGDLERRVPSPSWEDPLEEGTAAHASILAWRLPRTEEPGGLQSTGSQS